MLLSGCYLASFPPAESKPPEPAGASDAIASNARQGPPPPPTHAPTLPPLAPDEIPEHLGSQATSLAARPSFGLGGYAPQLPAAYEIHISTSHFPALVEPTPPDPCQVFREAKTAPRSFSALEGEMLACAAVTSALETKFAFNLSGQATTRADLRIYAAFDAKKLRSYAPEEVRADGPDDTGYVCITLPVVHLARGKALYVSLDNLGTLGSVDNQMGNFSVEFKGELPMQTERGSTRIACRHVPRLDVEVHEKEALSQLDQMISAMDASLVVRMDEPSDYGRLRLHLAKVFAEQAAAWVGWDDPRIKKRLSRLAMLEERFERELRDALLSVSEKLPPPSEWISPLPSTLSFRAPVFYCGDREKKAIYERALKLKEPWPRYRYVFEGLDCLVHIGVRNDTAQPKKVAIYADGISIFDIRLMDGRGFHWPLHWVGTMQAGGPAPPESKEMDMLNPGESVELLFDVQTDFSLGRTHYIPDSTHLLPDPSAHAPYMLYVSERGDTRRHAERTSRYLRLPDLAPGPR